MNKTSLITSYQKDQKIFKKITDIRCDRICIVYDIQEVKMNIRRIVLDVGKSLARPTFVELLNAIDTVPGVEAVNASVTDMDMETMGISITVEGNNIDYDELIDKIERSGSAVHSVDQIAVGKRLIENIRGNI